MKKTFESIKKYFIVWWIPMVFYLLPIGIFFLGTVFQRDWIIDLSLIVFFVNIIGTVISIIVQIVIGKLYFILIQLGLTIPLFYWTALIFMLSPPDYYGLNKEIPKGIEFNEPLSKIPTDEQLKKDDLILAHSVQPGIYLYYTDYQPEESGYFFIKVYEVTSNDRLSGNSIKKRSKIKVDQIGQKEYEGEFTIYEGSWGDTYGSRIELWFQPSNGKTEYKITERNYIVEGWMR